MTSKPFVLEHHIALEDLQETNETSIIRGLNVTERTQNLLDMREDLKVGGYVLRDFLTPEEYRRWLKLPSVQSALRENIVAILQSRGGYELWVNMSSISDQDH